MSREAHNAALEQSTEALYQFEEAIRHASVGARGVGPGPAPGGTGTGGRSGSGRGDGGGFSGSLADVIGLGGRGAGVMTRAFEGAISSGVMGGSLTRGFQASLTDFVGGLPVIGELGAVHASQMRQAVTGRTMGQLGDLAAYGVDIPEDAVRDTVERETTMEARRQALQTKVGDLATELAPDAGPLAPGSPVGDKIVDGLTRMFETMNDIRDTMRSLERALSRIF